MSTKPNFKGHRLLKQVCQSDFEYHEYGAPKIRHQSWYDVALYVWDWEKPERSDFKSRSWKRNRKTQYKPL